MSNTFEILSTGAAALALTLSLIANAQADGKLIVGTRSTNPPWGFQDKSGQGSPNEVFGALKYPRLVEVLRGTRDD